MTILKEFKSIAPEGQPGQHDSFHFHSKRVDIFSVNKSYKHRCRCDPWQLLVVVLFYSFHTSVKNNLTLLCLLNVRYWN